jgi:hypothetical protein
MALIWFLGECPTSVPDQRLSGLRSNRIDPTIAAITAAS